MTDTPYGYAGKILLLDLTDQTSETIDSAPYVKDWYGGHGLASKLFWDYCKDKKVKAFDPGNVVAMAANAFTGTLAPSGAARIELTGIGAYSMPEWYCRSSMGGRVGGMMKAAGYDAVVVQGKAEKPVWVSIVNDKVTFNDAKDLWGKDTWETQKAIWDIVTDHTPTGQFFELSNSRDGGRMANRPAVMAIGPAGEKLARIGTINHDAAHASGQAGFGGVWGSKNLKAVCFLGSRSFKVADPGACMNLRVDIQNKYGYNVDDPGYKVSQDRIVYYSVLLRNPKGNIRTPSRPDGCQGCYRNCRNMYADTDGNSSMCTASNYYQAGKTDAIKRNAAGKVNKLGINGYEADMPVYLYNLYKMGVMGKGKAIDTDLPFDKYREPEFINTLLQRMADREEIGDDLAEGLARAAVKWGRWDEDTASGLLKRPQWGFSEHYDPRLEVEWGYGSVTQDRDVDEHGFNWCIHHAGSFPMIFGDTPPWTPEMLVTKVAEETGLDPLGFDYSEEGIYSDAKLNAVAWLRHYSRFWRDSSGLCDWLWPSFINFANWNPDDYGGASPEGEVNMWHAVTGQDLSFEESIDMGKKFLLLDRAIWVMQGREREQEKFVEYVYNVPTDIGYVLPVFENGEWKWSTCLGRVLDREKFEAVKPRYYKLHGWSEQGYPQKEELQRYGLDDVAQTLDAAGKLG